MTGRPRFSLCHKCEVDIGDQSSEVVVLIIQNQLRVAATITLALSCCDCSGRPMQGVLVPSAQSAEGSSRVPELIATTRKPSTVDVGEMFNGDRAEGLSYASITISIPPDGVRKAGQIQWPASLPGDPGRDFCYSLGRPSRCAIVQRRDFGHGPIDWTKKSTGVRAWI